MAAAVFFVFFGAAAANAASPDIDQRLFDAVYANDLPAVQTSIGAGANPDVRNRWGLSSLDVAIAKGYYDIAHFLSSARNVQRMTRAPEPQATGALAAPQATRRAAATTAAKPTAKTPPMAVATPWPSRRPNPFDPSTPAPGTSVPLSSDDAPIAGDVAREKWDQVLKDEPRPATR